MDDDGFEKYKDKGVSNWYEVNIYILNNNFNKIKKKKKSSN